MFTSRPFRHLLALTAALAVALCLAATPGLASAVAMGAMSIAGNDIDAPENGKTIWGKNDGSACGEDDPEATWSLTNKSGSLKLTLNGLTIASDGGKYTTPLELYSVEEIELQGKNSLSVHTDSNCYALFASGSLTITGDGSLDLSSTAGNYSALNVDDDLTMNGGTLSVNSTCVMTNMTLNNESAFTCVFARDSVTNMIQIFRNLTLNDKAQMSVTGVSNTCVYAIGSIQVNDFASLSGDATPPTDPMDTLKRYALISDSKIQMTGGSLLAKGYKTALASSKYDENALDLSGYQGKYQSVTSLERDGSDPVTGENEYKAQAGYQYVEIKGKPSDPPKPAPASVPATGDGAPLGLWLALGALALCGMGALAFAGAARRVKRAKGGR